MRHGNLEIEVFVEPSFGENAYVVSTIDSAATDSDSSSSAAGVGRRGWVIDPSFPPALDELLQYIKQNSIHVEKIVLTHGHADHIAGLDRVKGAHPQATVWISAPEEGMLQNPWLNLSAPFGAPLTMTTLAEADLAPGINLDLGGFDFIVLDVAGHSPGGRAVYSADLGVAIVGDALFREGIGRTDFPGGDHAGLLRRVRENLLSLPDETVVYSGHGPATTVGNERKFNPFLSE